MVRLKADGILRLEPELNLALYSERHSQIRDEGRYPTACAQQKLARLILAVGCEYADSRAVRLPTQHRFVEMQIRSLFSRQGQMRLDASFGKENSGARLPDGDHFLRGFQRGEALPDLVGRKDLMLQTVLGRASSCAGNHRALRAPNHQSAGPAEQGTAPFEFQHRPQLVRALDEGDVERMLEVGLANDAGLPVRRPE